MRWFKLNNIFSLFAHLDISKIQNDLIYLRFKTHERFTRVGFMTKAFVICSSRSIGRRIQRRRF